jgi:hypothetical protein
MSTLRLIATGTVICGLLAAGVARADPSWSTPVPVASGITVFHRSSLTFSGDGRALATLDGAAFGEPTRILVAPPRSSAFTQIARAVLVAKPAPFGQRDVAYLRTPPPPPGPHPIDEIKVTRLGASLGRIPGPLGRFQPLARIATSPRDVVARVAADARGNVAAAWLEPVRNSQRLAVRVALRRPGHAFDRPRTIGEAVGYCDCGAPLDLAYGPKGDLVVVYQRSRTRLVDHRSLEIVVRVARRGRFGPSQSLGPARGSSSVASAVAPSGAAVVAWGTQDPGEEADEPWNVRAAVLRAGARRFSKAQLLDHGRVGRPVGPVTAAMGPDGRATVAWAGIGAGKLPHPVRVATAGLTGFFGAAVRLAASGVALGVVTSPDRTTTVLWGPLSDPEAEYLDGISASRRSAAEAGFAAPEAVSAPGAVTNDGSIALDPISGHGAALWIGATGAPPGQPLVDDSPVQPLYSTRAE